ncbi:hypothetical protein [Chamaesiphon minutus]
MCLHFQDDPLLRHRVILKPNCASLENRCSAAGK